MTENEVFLESFVEPVQFPFALEGFFVAEKMLHCKILRGTQFRRIRDAKESDRVSSFLIELMCVLEVGDGDVFC